MEVSENSKGEYSLKDSVDGSGKVEEVDFGEVIELPPEPVTKRDGPEAVEVIQAAEEGVQLENSGSSDVTAVEKEAESLSLVSGNEPKVEEEAVVASDFPVSDTHVEASSGVAGSLEKELDAGPSVPTSYATVGGGVPEVSEIPRSTEDQPSATLTHQTRTSWFNCCGLLDVVRGSN